MANKMAAIAIVISWHSLLPKLAKHFYLKFFDNTSQIMERA